MLKMAALFEKKTNIFHFGFYDQLNNRHFHFKDPVLIKIYFSWKTFNFTLIKQSQIKLNFSFWVNFSLIKYFLFCIDWIAVLVLIMIILLFSKIKNKQKKIFI